MATCLQVQAIAGIRCAACGQSFIPAPSGATASTRFMCRECCPRPRSIEAPEDEATEATCSERTTELPRVIEGPNELDDAGLGAWGTQSARAEALMLYAMLERNGDTAESIRELIGVPAKTEAALRAYARNFPEDAAGIKGVLEFRREVAEEFEHLVRESVPVASL